MVIEGLQELHELGFVQRDLKSDNIVVYLRTLYAVVIEFERSISRSKQSAGTMIGTPGYYPNFNNLRDGSTSWDVWALSAIILEAAVETGVYRTACNERGSLQRAEQLIKEAETIAQLRRLLSHTMLRGKDDQLEGLHWISEQLELVNFRCNKFSGQKKWKRQLIINATDL